MKFLRVITYVLFVALETVLAPFLLFGGLLIFGLSLYHKDAAWAGIGLAAFAIGLFIVFLTSRLKGKKPKKP